MLPWIFLGFVGFFVLERALPGWPLPQVRTWPVRVLAHGRLLNGSDYPLPGILPLISPDLLVQRGMLGQCSVTALREIRKHNSLLFDFVLKRSLVSSGTRLASSVFETRSFFTNPA